MPYRPLFCCCIALAMAYMAPHSMATTKQAKQAKDKPKAQQVRILKDSSESSAERNRRLLRECKGRPNAGACAGLTGR